MHILEDPNYDHRAAAAKTLSFFGKDAAPAISALEKALRDRSSSVRRAARDALAAIGKD